MSRQAQDPVRRFAAAFLAAVFTLSLGHWIAAAAPATQDPAAKKADDKKPEEEEAEQLPALKVVEGDEWLTMEPFDRLRLAVEMKERGAFTKQDKSKDKKLGRDEWFENATYPFELMDWNNDGFVDETEIVSVAIDVLPVERPLQLIPEPGKPLDPMVRITILADSREVNVLRSKIKEILYFEDMLLRQGREHSNKGEMNRAFEYFDKVASQQPNWPGLHDRVAEYWFNEANAHLRELRADRAIAMLNEMARYVEDHKNDKPPAKMHPRAKNLMGDALKQSADRVFETTKDYATGRRHMASLRAAYPDHDMLPAMERRFSAEAESLRKEAKSKSAAGANREAAFLILQAVDIWPKLNGIDEDFNSIFAKYPILIVGVRELPLRFAPWAPTGTPDARVAQLLQLPLMEISGVGENTSFSSRILGSQPELAELGRQITLRIKPGLKWSDGEKVITATDIARSITTRCDPNLAGYDAALASVVKQVRVNSPSEIVVDMKRTQLRPQTNFLFNLPASHRMIGDRFDGDVAVGAGPFRYLTRRTGQEANLQANQFFFAGAPKVSEIVERRYATGKDGIKALITGDVALLEHVPHRELRRLEAMKDEFRVVKTGVPSVHSIAFDFRTRADLQSHTLRRAMMYAIDRKAILEGAVLGAPAREGDELINGPFPRGSFAFEPSLEAWTYDPVLAKGLADASRKELKVERLRYTLQYPDVEEVKVACEFIREYWKIVGIDLELRPRPSQVLEEEIALGRRFELVYRIHHVRDTVLDAARTLCLGQPISPEKMVMPNAGTPWLRQNLRDLEFATGWPLAQSKLQLLQQQARDDVGIIPLWQLNDYFAYNHKRLKGVIDEGPLGIYQNAELWNVTPWYRRD